MLLKYLIPLYVALVALFGLDIIFKTIHVNTFNKKRKIQAILVNKIAQGYVCGVLAASD